MQDNNYSAIVGGFGTGTLDVNGTMDSGGNPLAIGYAAHSTGVMTVSGGGTVTVGTESNAFDASVALAVGHDYANGTLTITDPGSSVTADGNMYVGRGGTGSLVVENYGNLTAGATEGGIAGLLAIGTGQSTAGGAIGGTGSALVTSDGTIDDLGALSVGGNGVNGSMTVTDGGVVDVNGQILLGVGNTIDGTYHTGIGTLDVGAGGTVAIVGPAIFGAPGLAVGDATLSLGTLGVSGAGALLDLGSSNLVIGNSGTGTMTVSGGGTVRAAAPGPNSAAIVIGNNAGGAGALDVEGAGSSVEGTGALIVGEHGAGTLTVGSGAEVSATSATIVATAGSSGTVILSGGTLDTTNGIVLDSGGMLTGAGTVDGGIAGGGAINATGTLVFNGAIGSAGVFTIGAAGDAVFGAGVADTEILFTASTGRIDINAPGSFTALVNGFTQGDTIHAAGAATISYTGGSSIELFDGTGNEIGTIALAETYASGAFLDNSGTITLTEAPCFLAGTRLATTAGEIAVERLRIGDRVLTASGAARPIKWIGQRAYDGRFIRGNRDVLPIRIRAGALGENLPHRDLFVSPHHAMFIDGVLIPAEQLVNGVSIVQAPAVASVAYFHIELETHDVLLAEGAAAESFLDCDSRLMFHNAAEFAALYPDADPVTAACAPRVEGGETLRRICRRLASRAGVDTCPGALRGHLDAIERRSVSGWVRGESDAPAWVAVSVDGMPVARGLANRFRPDLAEAGIGQGWHAFRIVLPRALDPAKPHRISVRREADGAELPGSPMLLAATRAA